MMYMGLGAIFYIVLNQGVSASQRVVFNVDVVASACHVVVDADSIGNSGRLTFGTYRKSTGGGGRRVTSLCACMSPAPRFRGAQLLRPGRSPLWILVIRGNWTPGG